MDRRAFLLSTGAAGVAVITADGQVRATSVHVRVYEYTFLKSVDAKPDALLEFIVKNWFAIDKIAVEKGIIVNYQLYEAKDQEDWNVAVAVGYANDKVTKLLRKTLRRFEKATAKSSSTEKTLRI